MINVVKVLLMFWCFSKYNLKTVCCWLAHHNNWKRSFQLQQTDKNWQICLSCDYWL